MAIKITQPGEAKAAAKTGAIIGEGKRAEEDRAKAEREQARADQMAAQREARKAAMKWEQEKMAMRSQQDFQQELTAKQWEFEKWNRAKAWDIEKMEIASRMDFEREEKDRQGKIDKFNTGIKAIDESDIISDEMKERAKFNFARNYTDIPEAAPYLGQPESLMRGDKKSALSLLGEAKTPAPEAPTGVKSLTNPRTGEPVYIPEGQPFVSVRLPDGALKKIRAEQLQEAMDSDGVVYIPNISEPTQTPGYAEDLKAGKYGTGAAPLFGGGVDTTGYPKFNIVSPIKKFLEQRWKMKAIAPDGTIEEVDTRDWTKLKKMGYRPAPRR